MTRANPAPATVGGVSTAPRLDGASGTGLATFSDDGTILDTWFPAPALGQDAEDLAEDLAPLAGTDAARGVTTAVVRTVVASLADPPADAHDVYLRLHLLSHRLIAPHEANLDGIFGLLANVVWTDRGPCAVAGFERVRLRLRSHGPVTVYGVDKFPRMVDYVLPVGVRIADADRVRLGAHLAEGTTVMHEGFVNYNAGTLGSSMVEGRISAGVVVGDGSDVGGGASIMGTLSGGRQGGHLDRPPLPAGRQRGPRHPARRRLRRRGGALPHVRDQGHHAGRQRHRPPARWRARTACCFVATRCRAPSRCSPARARGIALNAALHTN